MIAHIQEHKKTRLALIGAGFLLPVIGIVISIAWYIHTVRQFNQGIQLTAAETHVEFILAIIYIGIWLLVIAAGYALKSKALLSYALCYWLIDAAFLFVYFISLITSFTVITLRLSYMSPLFLLPILSLTNYFDNGFELGALNTLHIRYITLILLACIMLVLAFFSYRKMQHALKNKITEK